MCVCSTARRFYFQLAGRTGADGVRGRERVTTAVVGGNGCGWVGRRSFCLGWRYLISLTLVCGDLYKKRKEEKRSVLVYLPVGWRFSLDERIEEGHESDERSGIRRLHSRIAIGGPVLVVSAQFLDVLISHISPSLLGFFNCTEMGDNTSVGLHHVRISFDFIYWRNETTDQKGTYRICRQRRLSPARPCRAVGCLCSILSDRRRELRAGGLLRSTAGRPRRAFATWTPSRPPNDKCLIKRAKDGRTFEDEKKRIGGGADAHGRRRRAMEVD